MANNKYLNKTIKKIEGIIKNKVPRVKNVVVEKSRGLPSKLHIIIVSDYFKGISIQKRQDYVWKILDDNLTPDELLRISLCLTLTEKESKEELVYV